MNKHLVYSLLLLSIFLGFPIAAKALAPMEYFNTLVAGGDDPGYQDGAFAESRFNQPTGLAFDDSGNQLFVADSNNNCVRVIHLDQNHQVETLAGSTTPGNKNGAFTEASFSRPTALAFIPGGQLIVFDSGTHLLRTLDLKSRTVSTLAGNKPDAALGGIWTLVYNPKDNGLYFSEPDSLTLKKLDLKTNQISTLLMNNPHVQHPAALCLYQDHLYVADRSLAGIFRVDMTPATTAAPATVVLTEAGQGQNIQELASTDGKLYALVTGAHPLVQLLPNYQPVTLTTTWGFMMDNENPGVRPFISFQDNFPVGFAVSPLEARKFYMTLPPNQSRSVLSVKDYRFEEMKYSATPYDFDYPETKPANTFRILVTSDSRMIRSVEYIPGLRTEDQKKGEFGDVLYENFIHSLRITTFAKKLEFMLNRDAALKGSKIHFEVLTYSHVGQSFSEYICYDIPPFVKKYDVDLVLGLAGWPGYKNFFERPMTAEGIPSNTFDADYLLKPIAERTPPGAPTRFYEGLRKKNLVKEGKEPSPGPPSEPDSLAIMRGMDKDIRDAMIEMDGTVLKNFTERLKKIDAPVGHPRNFLIFFVPWWDWYPSNDVYKNYWLDVCGRNHLNFLDLSPSFYTLEQSFYPTHDAFADSHYNIYGNELIAYLLSHYLPEQKWIP
jgi:sugar lactone lactonase YvrE